MVVKKKKKQKTKKPEVSAWEIGHFGCPFAEYRVALDAVFPCKQCGRTSEISEYFNKFLILHVIGCDACDRSTVPMSRAIFAVKAWNLLNGAPTQTFTGDVPDGEPWQFSHEELMDTLRGSEP